MDTKIMDDEAYIRSLTSLQYSFKFLMKELTEDNEVPYIAPREGSYDHEPCPRCSDFDDECKDVKDPFKCWSNYMGRYPDVANGYCPLMFNPNNKG